MCSHMSQTEKKMRASLANVDNRNKETKDVIRRKDKWNRGYIVRSSTHVENEGDVFTLRHGYTKIGDTFIQRWAGERERRISAKILRPSKKKKKKKGFHFRWCHRPLCIFQWRSSFLLIVCREYDSLSLSISWPLAFILFRAFSAGNDSDVKESYIVSYILAAALCVYLPFSLLPLVVSCSNRFPPSIRLVIICRHRPKNRLLHSSPFSAVRSWAES